VKDTNNLLTFNQWSSGEYNNTLNDFYIGSGVTTYLSNKNSIIGENCLQINSIGNSYLRLDCILSNPTNTTFKGTANILTSGTTSLLIVFTYLDNTQDIRGASVPVNNTFNKIIVNTYPTKQETLKSVSLRILSSENNIVFVDNFTLEYV